MLLQTGVINGLYFFVLDNLHPVWPSLEFELAQRERKASHVMSGQAESEIEESFHHPSVYESPFGLWL